jgi:hypothetical protein
MSIDWRAHFAMERQIKKLAIRAGIAKPRAKALAAQHACHPVRREEAAQLIAMMAIRRMRKGTK